MCIHLLVTVRQLTFHEGFLVTSLLLELEGASTTLKRVMETINVLYWDSDLLARMLVSSTVQ